MTVTKPDICKNHKVCGNDVSKNGGGYRAANKGFVKDLGTKYFCGMSRRAVVSAFAGFELAQLMFREVCCQCMHA